MAKKSRDISTTEEGEDDLADSRPQELENTPANRTLNAPKTGQPRDAATGHTTSETFRQDVHQQPVTRVDEDLGIGPRDPYPTGNPPDEREIFHSIHGTYPEDSDAETRTSRPRRP